MELESPEKKELKSLKVNLTKAQEQMGRRLKQVENKAEMDKKSDSKQKKRRDKRKTA